METRRRQHDFNLNENTESKLATCNAADLGAIIPLKDSVVVAKNKTWTGSEWTDGGHGKDKLIQMDGKTYAADSKGVYVYDADNRTWQTLTTEVTAGQYDQLNAANGKLSISANSGNNTSPRYTQMTILSIDSKTTEKVDTTILEQAVQCISRLTALVSAMRAFRTTTIPARSSIIIRIE